MLAWAWQPEWTGFVFPVSDMLQFVVVLRTLFCFCDAKKMKQACLFSFRTVTIHNQSALYYNHINKYSFCLFFTGFISTGEAFWPQSHHLSLTDLLPTHPGILLSVPPSDGQDFRNSKAVHLKMILHVFCMHVYLCATCVLGPPKAGRGCFISWSWSQGWLWVENQTQVCWKSAQCSSPVSHLSSP